MPSWKTGLVNAFPIPQDHMKRYTSGKNKQNGLTSTEVTTLTSTFTSLSISLSGGPFPFFALPAEIRNRIYALVLFSKDAASYRLIDGRLQPCKTSVMTANRQAWAESSYILYSNTPILLFPLQSFTPTPTIADLRPMYRSMVTNLSLVVGSSWTAPPKSWRVSKLLGKRLSKLDGITSLKVQVELDPSGPLYDKYRISPTFYTDFCGELLRDVLGCMPQVSHVEMGGNPGVEVQGPLVTRLQMEAEEKGKVCVVGRTKIASSFAGSKLVFA